MKNVYCTQVERSDVFEVQDFWNIDKRHARGKRRRDEIRRFFLFQVCIYSLIELDVPIF